MNSAEEPARVGVVVPRIFKLLQMFSKAINHVGTLKDLRD